jgi:hypothetical protein
MRAITEYTILTASATTYKGAAFHQNSTIRQHDAYMTTYAQGATLYHFHLYLGYNMHYILFHIYRVIFFYKTSRTPILFRRWYDI